MVDRVALVGDLSSTVRFSAADGIAFNEAMDKVVRQVAVLLPLTSAQTLSASVRGEFSVAIREILTMKELKALSKLWEPERKVWAELGHRELAADLIDLLEQRRVPYVQITASLPQARAWSPEVRARTRGVLERLTPPAHLEKLRKSWDRHVNLQRVSRTAVARHLADLMDGKKQPAPTPAPGAGA
jgi:hypothetical protein